MEEPNEPADAGDLPRSEEDAIEVLLEIQEAADEAPPPARPNDETVGVPRRFSMGAMMVMMALYAVVFAVMRSLDAHPAIFAVVTVFFIGVTLGQMFLFGGNKPRRASMVVGGFLLPAEVFVAYLVTYWGDSSRTNDAEMLCSSCGSAFLGVFCGYLAGTLVAGVFLLLKGVEKRKEGGEMRGD